MVIWWIVTIVSGFWLVLGHGMIYIPPWTPGQKRKVQLRKENIRRALILLLLFLVGLGGLNAAKLYGLDAKMRITFDSFSSERQYTIAPGADKIICYEMNREGIYSWLGVPLERRAYKPEDVRYVLTYYTSTSNSGYYTNQGGSVVASAYGRRDSLKIYDLLTNELVADYSDYVPPADKVYLSDTDRGRRIGPGKISDLAILRWLRPAMGLPTRWYDALWPGTGISALIGVFVCVLSLAFDSYLNHRSASFWFQQKKHRIKQNMNNRNAESKQAGSVAEQMRVRQKRGELLEQLAAIQEIYDTLPTLMREAQTKDFSGLSSQEMASLQEAAAEIELRELDRELRYLKEKIGKADMGELDSLREKTRNHESMVALWKRLLST